MQDTLLFKIAGLYLKITCDDCELKALKKLRGFTTFLVNDEPDTLLEYRSGASIRPIIESNNATGAVLLHKFDFEQIDCYFYREASVLQFDMIPRSGESPYSFRYIEGSNSVEATSTSSPNLLRFALWMSYGLLALPYKRIAIHSSVIVYAPKDSQEAAVLCLGESGTGKSTHTRLWRENIKDCYLLNDDSPIISFEDGEVKVYGSPWSGKTACFKQHSCKVAAIVRLSQAPHNKIFELNKLRSIVAVFPSCPPAFNKDLSLRDAILDVLSEILKRTKIYHLECLPDSEAAFTVFNELFPKESSCN